MIIQALIPSFRPTSLLMWCGMLLLSSGIHGGYGYAYAHLHPPYVAEISWVLAQEHKRNTAFPYRTIPLALSQSPDFFRHSWSIFLKVQALLQTHVVVCKYREALYVSATGSKRRLVQCLGISHRRRYVEEMAG